jgi:hypothetical protein
MEIFESLLAGLRTVCADFPLPGGTAEKVDLAYAARIANDSRVN